MHPRPAYPPGLTPIIGSEAAERFSFYGMRFILVTYMTRFLLDASGRADFLHENEAKTWFHLFVSFCYLTPFLGALVSDLWLGKYRTILFFSAFYLAGHAVLSLWETRGGLVCGLFLIGLGSGGIKPCVSSHMGDQFRGKYQELMGRAFGVFYFAINVGALGASLLAPWLLDTQGPRAAFGVPGLLMLFSLFVFWSGRHSYVAVPPAGFAQCKRELLQPGQLQAYGGLLGTYLFVVVFYSLYEQTSSSWVFQGERLVRSVTLGSWWPGAQFEILPSQLQAANPILVLLLIPLLTGVVYPWWSKVAGRPVDAKERMGAGFFLTTAAFAVVACIEHWNGQSPTHIAWQLIAYVFLTAGEILVNVSGYELTYAAAPPGLKSLSMGFFLLTASLGNAFTALVNRVIRLEDGSERLTGEQYFWFFCSLMAASSAIFWVLQGRPKRRAPGA